MSIFGTLGSIAGNYFGGPIGSVIGNVAGETLFGGKSGSSSAGSYGANRNGVSAEYRAETQRGLAEDLNKAYDNNRAIQERTMQRYGIPALANYEQTWALGRTAGTADALNRLQRSQLQAAAGKGNIGQQSQLGGILNLLPHLIGQNEYQKLINGGLINGVKKVLPNIFGTGGMTNSGNSWSVDDMIDYGRNTGFGNSWSLDDAIDSGVANTLSNNSWGFDDLIDLG